MRLTLINQIPKSSTDAQKVKWIKHTKTGEYIQNTSGESRETAIYGKNTATVYIFDTEGYMQPARYYLSGNYSGGFTAARGDMIIFEEISDPAPTCDEEFDAMLQKYGENAITVESVTPYIREGFGINHIEVTGK